MFLSNEFESRLILAQIPAPMESWKNDFPFHFTVHVSAACFWVSLQDSGQAYVRREATFQLAHVLFGGRQSIMNLVHNSWNIHRFRMETSQKTYGFWPS